MASLEQNTLVEIHKAWQALDEVLARVPSGHMDEPGAVGQWSIKDLIGHVTTWEREAMRMVQCYLSEGDPEVLAFPDVDQFNERTTQEKRSPWTSYSATLPGPMKSLYGTSSRCPRWR